MSRKSVATLLLAFAVLLPASGSSQVVTGRLTTSIYSWQRRNAGDSLHAINRAYQLIQLGFTHGNVGFSTYLNGAVNLGNDFGDAGRIRVAHAYAFVKNIGGVAEADIGRIPVYAGVGIGTVDGVKVKARILGERFSLTGYGGANVRPDLTSTGGSALGNNFLLGGQFLASLPGVGTFGVSYVNRRIARESYTATRADSAFNPEAIAVAVDARTEQLLGFDGRYTGVPRWNVYGRYDYELNLRHVVRGELSARFDATELLTFSADVVYREPRIWYSSFFSVLPFSAIREYVAGAEVHPACGRFSGTFGYVSYAHDVSRRLTLAYYHDYVGISLNSTGGLAGELASVDIQGSYPLMDYHVTPSAGIGYAGYREIDGVGARQEVWTALAGVTVRPADGISIDLHGQWVRNPLMNADARFFGKLSYWFSHAAGAGGAR